MERGFFPNNRQKSLYYALQGAGGHPAEVWVMCGPLLEESTFAARPWIELCDAIAGQGHAAMRFDYEGQGDSEGGAHAVSVQDWIDDIAAAVAFARVRCGPQVRVNLLALRGGALLAAAAAADVGAARLLLIAPVLDGGKYFEDCLRAHMTTQLACFNKVNESRAVLREQLQRGELVSVLGHAVGKRLSEPLCQLQLPSLLASLLASLRTEVDVIHVPRNAARGMPPAFAELSMLPGVTLHASAAPTFWDNMGRYWELSDELRALSLKLVGRSVEPQASGRLR